MNLFVQVKEQLLGSCNLSLVLVGTQTGLVIYWFSNSRSLQHTTRSKLCCQASEYLPYL